MEAPIKLKQKNIQDQKRTFRRSTAESECRRHKEQFIVAKKKNVLKKMKFMKKKIINNQIPIEDKKKVEENKQFMES